MRDISNPAVSEGSRDVFRILFGVITFAALAGFLYLLALYHYLLFHNIVEIFSIVIAGGMFMIAWNIRHQTDNECLVYLGTAYLFIGILDAFHTLSYKGMNIFTDYSFYANQLWIVTRYMEALSLLIFISMTRKRKFIAYEKVFLIYFALTVLVLFSVFIWKNFPICFIENYGQTKFKQISEFIICFILMLSLYSLHINRNYFERKVLRLLAWSIIFTVFAELAFTFYISNYGFSNFLGHIFKVISFYLIYKALIETGLKEPFNLIFKRLKESRELLAETQKISGTGGFRLTPDRYFECTEEIFSILETAPVSKISFEDFMLCFKTGDRQNFRKAVETAQDHPGQRDVELRLSVSGKKDKWLRIIIDSKEDKCGNCDVSGIMQDITEHKKIQELRSDIERITRHDLKTPVTTILMVPDMFDDSELNDDQRTALDILEKSAYKLLDMINHSLNLYKMEEGTYNLTRKDIDLSLIMQKAAAEIRPFAKAKKIDLDIKYDKASASDKDLVISGDEFLLFSMFSNLMKNAVEASPKNSAVRTNIKRRKKGIDIEISNRGTVPEDIREKFFEKFSTSGKRNGTGLGTYSARLISQLHGWKISMETDPVKDKTVIRISILR